jgi:hypothetical protein
MKTSFFLVPMLILFICFLLKAHARASQQNEMLQRLKNNNKWNSSVSLQATTRYSSTVNHNITITDITFIRDNDRCQWKGTSTLKTNENEIIKEGCHVKYLIMNGEQYLLAIGSDLNTFRRGSIKQTDYKETQNLMLDDPDQGCALWGRIYGNNGMDIYHLIEQSKNVKYGKSNFSIDGMECYEIEGTSKYGNVKIIFSPERGYFPLKWEITKKSGDYFDDKLLSGKHWKVTFQVEEVKNVGGFCIPLKGRMQHDIVSKNGQIYSDFYDYELSDIQISPDFEAINAFKFDLPSNVPVTLETAPGIIYNFSNGKLMTDVNQDFVDMLNDATKQIKHGINPETASTTDTSSKKLPIAVNMPIDTSNDNDAKQSSSEHSSFLMSVLILVGIIIGCVCGYLILHFIKRGGNAKF